jgi:hypothetical protein
MNGTNSFLPMLIVILYVVIIFFGGVFVSNTYKKYNQTLSKMKKDGSYSEWAQKNKTFLFFTRLFDYISVFCFALFIILSISKASGSSGVLTYLVFPFLLIATVFHLVLYFKLPKKQG